MSAPPSSAAAAASAPARGPPKKRPRHFWEGPDPAAAPVARLYRHALESVFGFLKLKDLSRALSVSRSWSAAVRSMRSIHAKVPGPIGSCELIAASPLAHHVSQIGDANGLHRTLTYFTSSSLFILSRHLGSLKSLCGGVHLPQPSGLWFGPSLQTINLQLVYKKQGVAAVNQAIVTFSRMPALTDLSLFLVPVVPAINFAPLAAAAQLLNLTLEPEIAAPRLKPQQLDQLRTIRHLRKMAVPGLSRDGLAYLLRLPHALEWQEIHQVWNMIAFDEDNAAALSTLPSLTKLDTYSCLSVAFLPCLTRLRTLALLMYSSARLAADIAAGLSCCPEFTDLTLMAVDVTSAHLSQSLSRMPLLRELQLISCDALQSLSFLSERTHLAQSLQTFNLNCCRNAAFHSTELKHILTLKSLTDLSICSSFVESLDACAQHLLHPPSVVLPKLQTFHFS